MKNCVSGYLAGSISCREINSAVFSFSLPRIHTPFPSLSLSLSRGNCSRKRSVPIVRSTLANYSSYRLLFLAFAAGDRAQLRPPEKESGTVCERTSEWTTVGFGVTVLYVVAIRWVGKNVTIILYSVRVRHRLYRTLYITGEDE